MSSETFTCEACGETFPKALDRCGSSTPSGRTVPGPGPQHPGEAGILCDACYEHIMARAQAEAPQLIGAGWREATSSSTRSAAYPASATGPLAPPHRTSSEDAGASRQALISSQMST